MAIKRRYVSYDIREGNDYKKLYAFIKKHHGGKITESLYLFESELDLDTFVALLRAAVDGDDTVYVIYRTGTSIGHRKVVDGS